MTLIGFQSFPLQTTTLWENIYSTLHIFVKFAKEKQITSNAAKVQQSVDYNTVNMKRHRQRE